MALDPLPTFPKDDYGKLAPRVAGVDRTFPSKRGWGPGWPGCQPGKLDNTHDVKRPSDGQGFNRPVRKELVELFTFLMQSTMDLGYEFRTNDEPDGGVSTYNCHQGQQPAGTVVALMGTCD